MNSPLSINEFSKRLELNTKIGNPKIKGSPLAIFTVFGQNKKTFYGEYDKRHFRLTRNEFIPKTPYIIEGFVKSRNKSQTEIEIEIRPIGFGYYWILFIPIISFLLINYIFLTHGSNLSIEIPIITNIFLLSFFLPSLTLKRKKKKLANEFYRIFEISEEQTT